MTEYRPGGQPRPFGADELDGVSGLQPDELAADTRLARELQASAARVSVRPSPDFADRVMAAVAREPAAAPARAARIALRRGALGAFLVSLRDAWRVTISPSFPIAMRAQAMAMVLVVVGLTAGTGAVAAGALGLLDGNRSTPSPVPTLQSPVPTDVATETPSEWPASLEPSPSEEPSPSDSAQPSDSAEPSDSSDPAEATETDEPADAAALTTRSAPNWTPTPWTPTPWTPTPTQVPSPAPSPTHDGEHGGEPPHSPEPTETPRP
jgi:hypothetical protein